NRALEIAEEIFPDTYFFIFPDAEWYIKNPDDLLLFCQQIAQTDSYPAYLIHLLSPGIDFCASRLIRNNCKMRFKGVVHEYLDCGPTLIAPESIYFDLPEKPQGIEASRKRWLRDLQLLLAEYEKNPNDARNLFYVAQTYDCLGNLEK